MSVRTCRRHIPNNHRHGLFWAVVGLLLLARIVPALAASPESMPVVPLTTEEQAWLKAHPDITFGYTDTFEPAVIVNPDGSYRGTLVDFLDLLNQRLGTDFKLTVKPIPDVFRQVSQKELAGVLSLHPDNADKRGFLKTRDYMSSYPTVFTSKGVAFTAPSDLAGKKIAIIDNVFFSQNIVDRYGAGSTLIKVKNSREGLARVRDGAADLYIGSSRNSYLLSKYQFFDLAPSFQFYEHPTPNVMAVRNDWPQLVAILNKGLAAISVEEIEAILRKWIGDPEPKATIELSDEEQTWLDQNRAVSVRAADWPPYMITREDGPPQGIAAEYLGLIKKRTGVNFEYDATKQPFAEFLEAMKQRSGPDMTLLISRTPEREEYFSFTTPYITTASVIFVHEDELIVDINGLAGKALAVPRGYNLQNILAENFPDIKLVLFDSDYDALKAVAIHKADAYIGNLIVASHIIHQYGLSGLKATAPAPPGEQLLSMGIRKDWPELTSIIDKALASITEAEKTAIRDKYVAVRYHQGTNSAEALKWILLVVGGASGVVFFFVFWNRSLAKRVRYRTIELENTTDSLKSEIAERNRTERALEISRRFTDHLVETANVMIVGLDNKGNVNLFNPAAEKITGYTISELYGKNWFEFLTPKERYPHVHAEFSRLIAGGLPKSFQNPILTKTGEERVISWSNNEIKEGDQITGTLSFGIDITSGIQAEQEILQYQQRLKALASQLTIAEEKERSKIAADLHDHVGHSLALARMQLNGILESESHLERKILVKDISNIMLQALQDILHTRAVIDSMAGLVLAYQAIEDAGRAAEMLNRLYEYAGTINDPSAIMLADSCRARLAIIQGKHKAVNDLLGSASPPVENMVWWLEIPVVTYCRGMIAQGSHQGLEASESMLRELLQLNQDNHNTCHMIQVISLQALVFKKQGLIQDALRLLEEAVELAAPGGWLFPFVEAGPPMEEMLKQLPAQKIPAEFMHKLTAAFDDDRTPPDFPGHPSPLEVSSKSPSAATQPLVEPLTNRELDVLELLSQRLQNKEIADKLFITTETVKGHLKNIYQKLGVSNRRKAVEEAKRIEVI